MREVAPLTLHACAAASGVFARVGLLWGFGMLVRSVRVCSGCSGLVEGCRLSGRGDCGCSGLVRFVRVCSGCSGLVEGCRLSGRGDCGCSGLVRFVRDVRGGSMWLEVSIGRSLVLLWKSDGITTWAGWGIGTAAVDGAASRGGCERVLGGKLGPLRCGRRWVWAPDQVWGDGGAVSGYLRRDGVWFPSGVGMAEGRLAGSANGRWRASSDLCAADGVEFGPQIKSGVTKGRLAGA